MKFLLVLCLFVSSNTNVLFAQSELDRFKTEEELAKEKASLAWYEVAIKEVKTQFNSFYVYISSFFIENTADAKKSLDDSNVFNTAEEALNDRNNESVSRAKALQEKTGLKGETKTTEEFIENQ